MIGTSVWQFKIRRWLHAILTLEKVGTGNTDVDFSQFISYAFILRLK